MGNTKQQESGSKTSTFKENFFDYAEAQRKPNEQWHRHRAEVFHCKLLKGTDAQDNAIVLLTRQSCR
jgi:hypothetical protein